MNFNILIYIMCIICLCCYVFIVGHPIIFFSIAAALALLGLSRLICSNGQY